MMAMVVNSTAVVINGDTIRRANVIANRIGNDAIGVIKAQMIDLLKSKLQIFRTQTLSHIEEYAH